MAGLGLADEVRALISDVNRSAPDVGALEEARVHVAAARTALASPDRRRRYEVPLDEIDEDTTIRLREEAGDHNLFRGGRNPLAPPLRVSTGVTPTVNPWWSARSTWTGPGRGRPSVSTAAWWPESSTTS